MTATGRRRCSASGTGWRCTSRRRSASTATTSCRSSVGDRIVGRVEPRFDRNDRTPPGARRLGRHVAARRGARPPRLLARRGPLMRRRRHSGPDYDGPMDFATRAIHAGQEPDTATGSVVTPIYQTSTFAQEAVGVNKGYDYARSANPTRTALEECLASLENAAHGHAFSSGIGATTTVMHLVDPGDHVVCVNDVYGGTYRMFSQVYEPKGYRFTYATPEELSADPASLVEGARLVWIEIPDEPAPERRRHRCRGGRNEGCGSSARRRQHLRDAVPPDAARPRRRHRPALDDEVPGRALGRHRRLRRDERPDDRGAPAVPPEVPGSRARAVRRVARAARREDPGRPHGPPLPERPQRGRVPRRAPASHRGAVARPSRPSRPRDRRAADARLRRNGVVPRRERGGGGRARRPDPRVDARREPRRCREPDRAPGPHDARLDGGGAVRGTVATSSDSRSGSSRPPTSSTTSRGRSSTPRRPPDEPRTASRRSLRRPAICQTVCPVKERRADFAPTAHV